MHIPRYVREHRIYGPMYRNRHAGNLGCHKCVVERVFLTPDRTVKENLARDGWVEEEKLARGGFRRCMYCGVWELSDYRTGHHSEGR